MARAGRSGMWVWLVVFVTGFAIGYGLMALFVRAPAPTDPQAVGEAPEAEPRPAPADTPGERLTAEATPTPSVRPGEAVEGEGGAPDETPPPVEASESPGGQEGDEAEDSEEASEPAEEAEPEPWWEACRGRTCRIDFGEITGGLLVRRGEVEHGATVEWDADFGGNPRLDALPTEGETRAVLHAVAFDAEGEPVAAELTWKRGGEDVTGVISLDLGAPGKQVRLVPAAERADD